MVILRTGEQFYFSIKLLCLHVKLQKKLENLKFTRASEPKFTCKILVKI